MKPWRGSILIAFAGVAAVLGIRADASAFFVPVGAASGTNDAVAGAAKELPVRIVRNELASVRDQVASRGTGRLLLNVDAELELGVAVERTSATRWGYSLSGRIDNPTVGFVTLVVHDEAMAGAIWTPDGSYEVAYLGGGLHAVREVVDDGQQCAGTVAASWTQPFVWAENTHAAEEDTVVDVLVVWTPQREEQAGGVDAVRAEIELGIAYTNDAFERSGAFVSLNLIGAEPVTDYEEPGTDDYREKNAMDIARLADPSDGHMDDVHRWRDALGADLVNLATHRGGGIAVTPGVYSVSSRSLRTVAHEFGHNFGLQHERAQWLSDFQTTYPRHYQHGYIAWSDRRCSFTIMAYGTQCVRSQGSWRFIPFYSSPVIPFYSSPALFSPVDGTRLGMSRFSDKRGAAGPADSVLHLNRVRNTIAGFKRRR